MSTNDFLFFNLQRQNLKLAATDGRSSARIRSRTHHSVDRTFSTRMYIRESCVQVSQVPTRCKIAVFGFRKPSRDRTETVTETIRFTAVSHNFEKPTKKLTKKPTLYTMYQQQQQQQTMIQTRNYTEKQTHEETDNLDRDFLAWMESDEVSFSIADSKTNSYSISL